MSETSPSTESTKARKRSWLKIVILAAVGIALLIGVGIQLKPVERTNPPVTQVVEAPDEVMAILRRSCFDCHSNETVWPWYSYVAPVSWKVTDHVNHGRRHVNFSQWDEYDAEERGEIIEESWEEVEKGGMPLQDYLNMHPEAELSDADRAVLKAWAENAGH